MTEMFVAVADAQRAVDEVKNQTHLNPKLKHQTFICTNSSGQISSPVGVMKSSSVKGRRKLTLDLCRKGQITK